MGKKPPEKAWCIGSSSLPRVLSLLFLWRPPRGEGPNTVGQRSTQRVPESREMEATRSGFPRRGRPKRDPRVSRATVIKRARGFILPVQTRFPKPRRILREPT